MARKTTRLSAPKAHETEMSQIDAGQKVRFGIGPKFTLPVTLALSLTIVVMGLVVYGSMADSLERQLDAQGVFAARIAAAPEIDSWEKDYNTRADLQTRLARIEAELALAGGDLSGSAALPATEQQRAILDRIAAYESEQQRFNLRRLQEILGSKNALDLWIVKGENDLRVSATGVKTLSFWKDRHLQLPSSPDTRIASGRYQQTDGTIERARFFQHPILNRKHQVVGSATVVVSEEQFRSDLESVKRAIILFCAFGILVCVGVALATSRVITRPLHALLKDIRAVAAGDLEHRTRVRSRDEVGTLAFAFDQMTRNLASAETMRLDLADKAHQVSVAQEVQERLFPRELPQVEGLALDANNRLAGELSSDLFDAIVLESGMVGCLVMTASGRGVPAAIVLSMARSIFRAVAARHDRPAAALKAMNALLAPDLRRGMYVSAVYAVIDPKTGEGRLASAGHRVPALHFVAAKDGLRPVQSDGIALGLDQGPVFDRSLGETELRLAPGDRLILATEGAVLLEGKDQAPLGEKELMRVTLAAARRKVSASGLLAAITERMPPDAGGHDLTLVIATRT